ncbi:MAG: polyprenyl synthetase family protein [Oscillospiraceae bacterium]|jgi:geranylgeranyl diphosphate synthase type II
MNSKAQKILAKYFNEIENRLYSFTQNKDSFQKNVVKAAEYSLSAGGKRIRPVLMLEFYKSCGGKKDVLSIACAIEMLHTFSLIHDDLPCMDNDDFRRGKPSCHKAFGEAAALLAGDALAVLPFEIISREALSGNIDALTAVKLISELSHAVGTDGMIGGQIIDIENENNNISEDFLKNLDSLKTGALIRASCVMGCILAGADENKLSSAVLYAEKIGLAFQIVDDILDVTSTFEELGKPISSDERQNKTTYVTLLGLEKSKLEANRLTKEAVAVLDNFDDSDFLKELTLMLLDRNN